ncbi:hypothetical protein AX16_004269 [Volvariella volvacea WC 439]|nr:hypothetical protein AX16_004269 [Volvariella volvacea WC 439]
MAVFAVFSMPADAQKLSALPSPTPTPTQTTTTFTDSESITYHVITTTFVAYQTTHTLLMTEAQKCVIDCGVEAQSVLQLPGCTTDTPSQSPPTSPIVTSPPSSLSSAQIGILTSGIAVLVLAIGGCLYLLYHRHQNRKRTPLNPIPFSIEDKGTLPDPNHGKPWDRTEDRQGQGSSNGITPFTKGALATEDIQASLLQRFQVQSTPIPSSATKRPLARLETGLPRDNAPLGGHEARGEPIVRRMNTKARRRQASLRRQLAAVERELGAIARTNDDDARGTGHDEGADTDPLLPRIDIIANANAERGQVPTPESQPAVRREDNPKSTPRLRVSANGDENADAAMDNSREAEAEAEADGDAASAQVAQLRSEIERLNRMLESAWALGDSDVPPPGYCAS